MMGGLDGARRLMEREVTKPKNVGATLARFGQYFRKYWFGATLSLAMVIAATYTQVTAPELIGQSVDCYFFPRADACWYTTVDPAASADTRIAGLLSLVGILVALFLVGSILQGMAFYAMNWSGQHVLRRIREDLFNQIHRLSLSYYAENEAGNVMSRITNDTDTIQQVLGFAL